MEIDIKEEILEQLKAKGYQDITVKLYAYQLFNLFEYFPKTNPKEITKEQVKKYASSLISKNYSRSTLSQLIYACNFFYIEQNSLHKGYYNIKLPPESNQNPEFFLQSEVLEMIEAKINLKHKSIILLLYSCGLESSELLNIKVEHIRSSDNRPHILIYDNNGSLKRKAYLSKRVLPTLREYYITYTPKSWLFYSTTNKDKQYSPTSVRKMIGDTISELNLNPELKSKSLKYSYIKHLSDLGIPLAVILNHLGIQGVETQLRYAKLIYGEDEILFTPLDKKINENQQTDDFKDLEHLIFELDNESEIHYLIEGVTCFRNGAIRAGVIFIWSAAINNIRTKIIESYEIKKINQELISIDPKSKQIKNIESFEFVKDSTLLLLAEKLGLHDKFQKMELTNFCLSLRNKCGHPSNYTPEIQKVKAFVEDVINMVYK